MTTARDCAQRHVCTCNKINAAWQRGHHQVHLANVTIVIERQAYVLWNFEGGPEPGAGPIATRT